MYIYIYISIHTCFHVYMYKHTYLCVYTCIHTYVWNWQIETAVWNLVGFFIVSLETRWQRFGQFLKVGLGISRTNADSQWNPIYNVFHRKFCCGNETIRL